MVHIVVMGHGGYAEGIKQNIEMITGIPSYMHFVDLTKQDDYEAFERKAKEVVVGLDDEEVLFACDLLGASPFRVAAMLTAENPDKYVTVCGLNTMAFMELGMESDLNAEELADRAIETTKASVAKFPK